MIARIVMTRRADAQIGAIEDHLALEGNSETAEAFIQRILARCERILGVPRGGRSRPDLGRSLRSVPFERSATIVYLLRKDAVVISGIFYGGQDLSRHYRKRTR